MILEPMSWHFCINNSSFILTRTSIDNDDNLTCQEKKYEIEIHGCELLPPLNCYKFYQPETLPSFDSAFL